MVTVTEKELLDLVQRLAALGGWMAYHTYDSRRSNPGFPDVVLVRPPELIFIELKTVHGRVKPEQTNWLRLLGACDQVEAFVVRPDDFDTLAKRLTGRKQRARKKGRESAGAGADRRGPAGAG